MNILEASRTSGQVTIVSLEIGAEWLSSTTRMTVAYDTARRSKSKNKVVYTTFKMRYASYKGESVIKPHEVGRGKIKVA